VCLIYRSWYQVLVVFTCNSKLKKKGEIEIIFCSYNSLGFVRWPIFYSYPIDEFFFVLYNNIRYCMSLVHYSNYRQSFPAEKIVLQYWECTCLVSSYFTKVCYFCISTRIRSSSFRCTWYLYLYRYLKISLEIQTHFLFKCSTRTCRDNDIFIIPNYYLNGKTNRIFLYTRYLVSFATSPIDNKERIY
jgi:hypothetical protein